MLGFFAFLNPVEAAGGQVLQGKMPIGMVLFPIF